VTPRGPLRTALALVAFTGLATLALAGFHAATRERIEAQARAAELRTLAVLLPDGYDNDPLADRIAIGPEPALGLRSAREAWRARRGGAPLGVVLPVVAPDGYSGDIEMRVGIANDGRIVGVRVVAHRETPGLGDPIEAAKSDWIEGFRGRFLGEPPVERWTVRKDGGEFDQFAGATITPRAVVVAVRKALDYHAAHRDELYREERSGLKPLPQ
jgi:electron transport complex protein RnfG